jgi:hypothetical protein
LALPTDRSRPAVADALAATLDQLLRLIATLDARQYQLNPVGVFESSIGAHVRHCLDHVDALLTSLMTGCLNYDLRQRGTDIETDPVAARLAIRRQQARLGSLSHASIEGDLSLSAIASPDRPTVLMGTTFGRELTYVLSHTVHHLALIAAIAKTMNLAVPERFGYAPATIAYLEAQPCAR